MLTALCIALGPIFPVFAQGIKTPAPSPAQTIKQDFALSFIELTYSRPGIKGRTIFGDLVPYGKLWRTGANAATRVKFGEEVTVGGQAVKAGDYVLYTIPNKDEWVVILNKGLNNWGTEGYKESEDVARFTIKPTLLSKPVETFTIQIGNIQPGSAEIQLMWDKTSINIPVVADIDSKIMAQIDNALNKDNRPYFQAAAYYLETGRDLKKALEWFDKALVQNPDAYWIYYQKARALAKSGDKAGAKATAEKSISLAKAAKNDDYVALNEKLIAGLK